jgi:DNA polymerase-3 subunit epsilon
MSANTTWVVIDFETASRRGTPCQVAALRIRDGVEEEAFVRYVHQPADRFDSFNVSLHGITPDLVADAPPWPVVKDELLEFAGGAPLVSHYAPYDMGVIRDACDLDGLEWPTVRYTCTVSIARMVWPGLPSYSLLLLASALGLSVDDAHHHDALYDTRLAAEILRCAMAERHAADLDELLAASWLRFGEMAPDGWYGSYARSTATVPEADLSADPDSPFYGKVVVFTGELAMLRRAAWLFVAEAGGQPEPGVTKRTNMLVCGYQDMYKLAAGETKSSKLRKAEQLHATGNEIEIVTERDFFRLLESVERTRRSEPATCAK